MFTWRKKINPLPVLFFTVFMDLLGFGILIPILPQLLGNPSSPFYLLAKNTSATHGYILLGLLLASFPLAQFICTPILGQLSDAYGRRRIILLSVTGTALAYVAFALGVEWHSVVVLFASRLFAGATGGNVSASQAAVADITPPADRAKNFGLIVAASGLGFIIGPYLGGVLSDPSLVSWFNAATPFWCAALFSFINVISIFTFFPETLKKIKNGFTLRWHAALINLKKAWNLEALRTLFGTLFLFNMGLSFLITFVGVFLIAKFSFTQTRIGEYYAFAGLCIALSQALLPRILSKRYGDLSVLKVCLLGSGLGILFLFFVPVVWMLWAATPIFCILIGLVQAHAASTISRSAGADIQGEVFGINASLVALSQTIPPIFSGLAAAWFSPEAPVLLSSLFMLVAGVIFLWLSRRTPHHHSTIELKN